MIDDTTSQAGTPNNTGTATVALPPLALLRELDRWLYNSGHDDDRPWRQSILSTLAAHGGHAQPDYAKEARKLAAALFCDLACHASALVDLLRNGGPEAWPVAITSVAQIGWMADAASDAHGGATYRSTDFEEWAHTPSTLAALRTARARRQGGAA